MVFTVKFPTVFKFCRHRVIASSNFAAVTFFTVVKMCRHRVNAVLESDFNEKLTLLVSFRFSCVLVLGLMICFVFVRL